MSTAYIFLAYVLFVPVVGCILLEYLVHLSFICKEKALFMINREILLYRAGLVVSTILFNHLQLNGR